ncbi:NAD-dependent succinate-semialdehyde dehydrogenase [Nesterenkonia lutea]|uniref:Succinate-semialdehyde dehydrogenase/glutarate-semialdehyde dehydrogenase n=1 Tax=Nesterenkonia lutea TaxID=272919 RepID=A0ABR9JHA2_9MICC|nr:NAD-dependent succinate-semialdehyde dehydrogenase [Nesterenkonia lutea]MBE1525321.1 succinate-semialdehyde dehydrogenase/glutarate-semialdehyde dehydrogenase [Nesterenkonia lutea]
MSTSAATFPVTNPATGEHLQDVADIDADQALQRAELAQQAFLQWREKAPRARAEILARAHALMIEDVERLRDLIVAENGKSRADAEAEVRYAAEFFRWYAEEAVRIGGQYTEAPAGGVRNIVTHHPVGVALLITPWNFPAAMATRKIGPALAAGCAVVLKPARETPLTAIAIAEILQQAGLPEGVLQIVTTTTTRKVVSALLADDRIKKVSFTGSTPVGRTLLAQCAERVVNASMELGGNAPFIVTADADVEAAVQGAMIAKFRNSGQACTAANRFYVHADVAEEFIAGFGARIQELTVGDPAGGAQLGPVIHDKAAAEIREMIQAAVDEGATASHVGTLPADTATESFIAPTLLRDVPADAAILSQEIFGPVAPVVTWEDPEVMLALANAAEVGLASYVYAGDLQQAIKIAERLEAGMVGVNRGIVSDPSAPFGGVKQAGIGREGGHWGIEEFTEPQYLSVDWSN